MLSKLDTLRLKGDYEKERTLFVELATRVQKEIAAALSDQALRHMVTSRAKAPASLERKLWKERERWSVEDFRQGLSPPLKDLAGVRVLLYLEDDVETAVRSIIDRFTNHGHHADKGRRYERPDAYCATHLHVHLDENDEPGPPCEIQVCTITDHLWNELEHDIVYKQPGGQPDDAQRELLLTLRRSLSMAAETASRLMGRTANNIRKNQKDIDGPDALRLYLEGRESKVLQGDFAALYLLLNGLMAQVTPANLDQFLYAEEHDAAHVTFAQNELDPDGAHQELAAIIIRLIPHLGHEDVKEWVEALEEPVALLKFASRTSSWVLDNGREEQTS